MNILNIGIILATMILASCNFNADRFDTEPQEIHLAGHEFSVPRNYLLSGDKLHMRLLLPEFEPRTKENESLMDDVSARRYINIKFTEVDSEAPSNSFDDRSKIYMERRLNYYFDEKIHKNGGLNLNTPAKTADGYFRYDARETDGWAFDLYVKQDNSNIEYIKRCTSTVAGRVPPNPQCEVDAVIFGNIKIKYWYPVKFKDQSIDIHNKLRNLLTSFKQESNKK